MSHPPGFINAVYYPSWRIYKGFPPSSLPVNTISHILYAFVRVNEDGTFRSLDEWADTGVAADGEKGCLPALAKLKHQHPHLRTLLSIGGGGGSAEFPKMAASPKARETFARESRAFVDRHSLDGIDIDWEHPQTSEQGKDYIRLLQAIRQALPSPRYLLTTALPVGQYCLKHIDMTSASQLLDYLNLMGYDFTGSWTDVSGHHAQLLPPPGNPSDTYPTLRTSTAAGVDYLLGRGFPSRKIILGIPAYARYFPGARGPGHPFKDAGEMDYIDFPEEWVEHAKVDEYVAAASFVDSEKGFVSFDVPATVRIKARYTKAMALGGLFYWTGVGDRTGRQSLVLAGFQELHS